MLCLLTTPITLMMDLKYSNGYQRISRIWNEIEEKKCKRIDSHCSRRKFGFSFFKLVWRAKLHVPKKIKQYWWRKHRLKKIRKYSMMLCISTHFSPVLCSVFLSDWVHVEPLCVMSIFTHTHTRRRRLSIVPFIFQSTYIYISLSSIYLSFWPPRHPFSFLLPQFRCSFRMCQACSENERGTRCYLFGFAPFVMFTFDLDLCWCWVWYRFQFPTSSYYSIMWQDPFMLSALKTNIWPYMDDEIIIIIVHEICEITTR